MPVLQPGAHIGGHQVLRLLGTGNFALVYEVITPSCERRAAKVLNEEEEAKKKPQARLGQEGVAIARLDHPNVVRFHGAGTDEGRVWILMELVEGPDLRQLLEHEGGSLPVDRAVRIVRGACEGVAAAHREGILHRDLKPENILIGPDDTPKVADFGSAKLPAPSVRTTNEPMLSSYWYLSPERLKEQPAEPGSDVYAMGVILYEIIAGRSPIEGPSRSSGS